LKSPQFLLIFAVGGKEPAALSGTIVRRIYEVNMKGDYCTREGAERLKAQIEAYWADRGKDVKINLIQAGFLPSMRSARTDVRSNMINGVPSASTENFA